jgi:hypothetical protein
MKPTEPFIESFHDFMRESAPVIYYIARMNHGGPSLFGDEYLHRDLVWYGNTCKEGIEPISYEGEIDFTGFYNSREEAEEVLNKWKQINTD